MTASKIIRALKAIVARNEIPEKVRSDNGPTYDSQVILQGNGFSRLHQVAPGIPSQMARQRGQYRQLIIY